MKKKKFTEENNFTKEEIEEERDIVRICKLILKVLDEKYHYGPLKELLTELLRARHKVYGYVEKLNGDAMEEFKQIMDLENFYNLKFINDGNEYLNEV
eukprot:gene12430-6182_t